jgi:hypothetical protein
MVWYLAAPAHRPSWMRVDRLLGEHGVLDDSASGRQAFERRMERRRREGDEGTECKPLESGWCLGSNRFRADLLERMDGELGEHHSGQLRRESSEAKEERIIAEELNRLKWAESDLAGHAKSDGRKLALAERLRRETTLTIRQIALRLQMGSWKSLNNKLYLHKKAAAKEAEK